MQKIKKNNKGFTLVELIVVIAILGVLAAVLAPQYIQYVERSRLAKDQNNAATLLTEVQVALADPQNTITAGTITMNSTNTTAATTNIATFLTAIDANWNAQHVTNTTTNDGFDIYTITITPTGATGAWSNVVVTPSPSPST